MRSPKTGNPGDRLVRRSAARALMESLEQRRMLIGNVIAGIVFDDLNGNGVRNSNEPGLANQVVFGLEF
jgi:hypothetical protein